MTNLTPSGLIGGLGCALAAAAGIYVWYHQPQTAATLVVFGFVVVLVCLTALALLYGSVWLVHSRIEPRKRWWACLWTFIGFVGTLSVVLLGHGWRAMYRLVDPSLMVGELLLGGSVGAVGGLLIGIATVDSMESTEAAERQREGLVFVNRLLRHNIRNGVQVIQSYADLVQTNVRNDSVEKHSELISHRARRLNTVVDEAQSLTESLSNDLQLGETDLSEILRSELNSIETAEQEATFHAEIEDGLTVWADSLLHVVFENVLSNAVDHHDGEPTVHVEAERTGSDIIVKVRDDGPGIESHRQKVCFEPGTRRHDSSGEGFGLYLVHTLISRYDGEIRIEDNEPRGTIVRIRLDAV